MIQCRQLVKKVTTAAGDLAILNGVDLQVAMGESVAIVGTSGSGKTTLLTLMAGLDTPTDGSVALDGTPLFDLDEDGRAGVRARCLGFVFQSFQLLPALTAFENVLLPLELKGVESAETDARDLLQRVGLGDRLEHYPSQLSGGEQQRVAIARAFASKPRILFADEPTGNLDEATGEQIIDLLFELNQLSQCTLVLVTHERRLAQRCQRQVRLRGGILHEETVPC